MTERSSPGESSLVRLLAAGLGTLLALAAGALVWWRGPAQRTFAAAAAPKASAHTLPLPLDEADVRRIFTIEKRPGLHYDEVAYLVPDPERTEKWTWKEHPQGRFVRRTNNLGLMRDQPTRVAKTGLRVLVSGDSHTSGLVDNSESFCAVAERELQRMLGREDVEVLNAGVGYTSPTCYLGMLKKRLDLQPDVFVTVVFAGNDFLDETNLGYQAGLWPSPETPPDYYERAKAVQQHASGPFWQGLNQAYRWKQLPGEEERPLALAHENFAEIERLCAEHGIALLCVLLPTKMDVDEDDRETWLSAAAELGLDERDVGLDLAIGRRLLDTLRSEGVACLDPTDEMLRSREMLYWKADYHLAVVGHALLGRLLARELVHLVLR